jgi:hypothetical protein
MSFTGFTRPFLKVNHPNNNPSSPTDRWPPAQSFDPTTDTYGHGTTRPSDQKKSILHPDLKTIPHQPQVQLIGNGLVDEWEGLTNVRF